MKIISGGITAPMGFQAASAEARIKYEGRKDMAMIMSTAPCRAAGVYTTNKVKAAPVLWDKEITDNSPNVKAVVINSGIANACTGQEGMEICRDIAEAAGSALHAMPSEILVCSTGVIGMQIPLERMKAGIGALVPALSDSEEAGLQAARAIMTTDTKPKQIAVELSLSGRKVTIGAMCKGSGMIAPNMCTMLAFVTTDAAMEKSLLQKALKDVVEDTFNMVSVDGDTSTNDTLLLLANGEAENPEITEENEEYHAFCNALYYICEQLARQIAADGEGATKLLTVKVKNAASKEAAKTMARSIARSSLVKAAMYGSDANWGRILCAMGYAGVPFDPEKAEVGIESEAGSLLLYNGAPVPDIDEDYATKILKAEEVIVNADCHDGEAGATAWGCDLTYDYVKINADYRS